MDEQALRAMVREAVTRHLQQDTSGEAPTRPLVLSHHASHARYGLPESDGPCMIEPTVHCNHCGYCQSHGH